MTNGLSLSVFILLGQITQNTPEGYNMATFTKIFCIKKYWSELKVCQNSQFFLFTDNSITTHLQSFLGFLLATNQSVDDPVCPVLGLETIESLVARLDQLGCALPALRLVGDFPLPWREIVLTELQLWRGLPLAPAAPGVQPSEVSQELSSDVNLLPVRRVPGPGGRAGAVRGGHGQICRAWTGGVSETEMANMRDLSWLVLLRHSPSF